MPAPLMISSRDDVLTGIARRSDPLGLLAVWSTRARKLVPHLTEQTTDVRGFQILVEAFRLWTIFVDRTPQPSKRQGEFCMLVEQAFARTIGRATESEFIMHSSLRRVKKDLKHYGEAHNAKQVATQAAKKWKLDDGEVLRVKSPTGSSTTTWVAGWSPHTGNVSVRRIKRPTSW